jgi:rod shape-determining protein MreC
MDVLGRYRNLIVLVGVLFAQILGLAMQVRRTTDNEPTRLIRIWAVGAASPIERTLVWIKTSSGGLWHNYFYLRGVRAENRSLKEQIERMRLEQVRMSQDADQARRLQALLAFKEQFISQTTAAQVIGGSGSEQSRLIYIDKGYNDGIRPDMAVITGDGVVGKVLRADPANRHVAQVLLIDDQSSGVGAILEKTRLQGILRGRPTGEVMLEKVMSDETVPAGEQVLTSGGDGIFPKGLLVGRVTKVAPGGDLFLNIRVRPAADLGRLEEVLVVTKIDERQIEPEHTGGARAVDILAERLPGVPSKAEDAGKNAATSNAGAGSAAAQAAAGTTGGGTKPAASTSAPSTVKPANAGSNAGSDAKKSSSPPPQASAIGVSPASRPTSGSSSVGSASVGSPVSSSSPASANSTTGSAGSAVAKSAASLGTSSGSKASAIPPAPAKVSPKPVKAAIQPKPQPAVEDNPH